MLFCSAGNTPDFLLNLVQRYNKFLIYANYLLKKCIIYVFFMRMTSWAIYAMSFACRDYERVTNIIYVSFFGQCFNLWNNSKVV